MPEEYTKIEWVPKETLDEKTNTLYIDHRNLVRKEKKVVVLSPQEFSEMFRKALKNYDSNAILKFKPSNTQIVHLFHYPAGEDPIRALD